MSDLEQRVKALETKVKILEETLETLKDMQLSDQMNNYIQSKSRDLKLVDLLNSVTDNGELDLSKERESIEQIISNKKIIDENIEKSLRNTNTFLNNYSDPSYFDYEDESGIVSSWYDNDTYSDINLKKYIGKGIRITSYNGFDSKNIVIPKEINGKPVISIGENVFKNTKVKEIIIPNSVKIILRNAFEGCTNLKHIALPNDLTYIGTCCFSKSGIESINIPKSVQKISRGCFGQCINLTKVTLGCVKIIENSAFFGCRNLSEITLPTTTTTLIKKCFSSTNITKIIIPSEVTKIQSDCFKGNRNVTCVFLGKETEIVFLEDNSNIFYNVNMIYCLPGSNVQKVARMNGISIKPLSEFRME
ncbi:MAG: leucine-rich repeat domain-containing protein [Erysipelotrichaceae bacterium]|nr:leucine-rich repeat domain-containing protein [Erysipelotrichaceae bacterium]